MALNKEKIVCVVCVLIFVSTIYFSFATLGQVTTDMPDFVMPSADGTMAIGDGPDDWTWFQFPTGKPTRVDPFEQVSQWSGANPDPMALPPRRNLARRVPLPGTLGASVVARPVLELVPPEVEEDDKEEEDDEE